MFSLCKELKIDDPIVWFNAVPDTLIDWWAAYEGVLKDRLDKTAKSSGMMDPTAARDLLGKRMKS